MNFILKNGFVVDPENNLYGKYDILVKNGIISKIGENMQLESEKVYDLEGKTVFPGFIDMHVHLREPGGEAKETIESGLKAAVAGGFTGVAPMPNTNPVCDNKVVAEYVIRKAKDYKLAKIHLIGAITKNEAGEELANIEDMVKCGIVAVSDDGRPVTNSRLTLKAFEMLRELDIPLISHSEDSFLSKDGVMNLGEVSKRVGLTGIPDVAEEVMVARDIILAEATGAKLHIAHASTKGTLRMVKEAKDRGVKVTVEVAPHHFSLTDDLVEERNCNPDTKVNPPLRTKANMESCIEYIKNGIVDMIATDHAPHTEIEKQREYKAAPFGISGIETAIGFVVTNLLNKNIIDLNRMAELMSINARRTFNIKGGIKLEIPADLTIIDLNEEWIVDRTKFYSKGKNTPVDGMRLKGKAYMTVVDGRVCMENGKVVD